MSCIYTTITYFLEELQNNFVKYRNYTLSHLPKKTTHDDLIEYNDISLSEWCDTIATYKKLFHSSKIFNVFEKIDTQQLATRIFEHFQFMNNIKGSFITIQSKHYPKELFKECLPPLALNVLGNTLQLKSNKISIVGSRKASNQGLQMSYDLGQYFAKKGYAIVSGGAFGCDIHAHIGCLDLATTPTCAIVVMPSGLSNLVPQAHQQTFQHLMSAGGAVISERIWDAPARRYDFLRRNRLIAALGEKLIVVECAPKSGAMSTANMALDLGIDVFASARQLRDGDVRASGNAELIENGASFFYSPEEAYDLVLQDS